MRSIVTSTALGLVLIASSCGRDINLLGDVGDIGDQEDPTVDISAIPGSTSGASAPPPPPPLAPASAALSATGWHASNSTSPGVSWAPASGASRYEVSVGTVAGGVDVVDWTSAGSGSSFSLSGVSLPECIDLYMSVRAVNSGGSSPAAMAPGSFKADATAPSAPVITAITQDPTATKSATITWTASTDNCELSNYRTNVGTTSGGVDVVPVTTIPSSAAMTSYQIEDSIDSFSLSVTSDTDNYTSLMARDAAGNSSTTVVSSAWRIYKTCLEMHTAGVVASGLYTIDSDGSTGNAPHRVSCDMTTASGGWTVVFDHKDITTNLFASKADAREFNVGDPLNNRYSILTKVNEFKRAGRVEMLLRWPVGPACTNSFQHWFQNDGPLSVPHGAVPPGYSPVSINSNQSGWTGLCVSTNIATLVEGNCANTQWWYAIGQVNRFGPGAPGCGGSGDTQTQLLVR